MVCALLHGTSLGGLASWRCTGGAGHVGFYREESIVTIEIGCLRPLALEGSSSGDRRWMGWRRNSVCIIPQSTICQVAYLTVYLPDRVVSNPPGEMPYGHGRSSVPTAVSEPLDVGVRPLLELYGTAPLGVKAFGYAAV
ncbi:hypothetical protein P167DRAFT_544893 [Morchella conica CCBAS932]|uniref:Uncharacterized protein n=1 Tax=Morchella conica CCBAS932 TaxID=1392247 RepID=A0A3N4KRV2_9PEZI|nr:hypothetical protein P167DRAFT_544893 [Morchella conica CCBAS932]